MNYQVYNNFGADKRTNKAVQDTKGQILCQNGEPITAYYFSTSAGRTSTDEIWGADRSAAYLKSVECDFDQNMPGAAGAWKFPGNFRETIGKSGRQRGIYRASG